MKNLIVVYDKQKNFKTELEERPIPSFELRPHDILIKVAVAGSNPRDWKHPLPESFNKKLNQGDDVAGTIAKVGSAVRSFKSGDRVAGSHEMDTPNGTYAEYASCPEQTVFRIPDSMSDEEAATFPLTIYTAAVGFYRNLKIPAPWDRSDNHAPVPGKAALVSTPGHLRVSPIIATAGSSLDFVKSLGVDAVVDYRSKTVAEDIKKAAGGVPIKYAFDAANSVSSLKYLTAVLEHGGRYTSTGPISAKEVTGNHGAQERLASIWYGQIWVGDVHGIGGKAGGKVFGGIMSRVIEDAIFDDQLKGHPYEVVENGLDGVYDALVELKSRKRGGNAKFVTRIADTPSLK